MPRPNLFRTSDYTYHVRARSNNNEWFYLPMDQVWNCLCNAAAAAIDKYAVDLHLLVMMSNHIHALVTTPHKNLDEFMQFFLSQAARQIQIRARRTNHIFGTRYKYSILETPHALAYCYKYVCRNPIRAGICTRVEDYPYCTINSATEHFRILERFDDYWRHIPRNNFDRLKWLNNPTPKEQEALVKKALRRFKFAFPRHSNEQKKLRLLASNYGIETKVEGAILGC